MRQRDKFEIPVEMAKVRRDIEDGGRRARSVVGCLIGCGRLRRRLGGRMAFTERPEPCT